MILGLGYEISQEIIFHQIRLPIISASVQVIANGQLYFFHFMEYYTGSI